ncbi:hypothetical protein BDF19DRAFT_446325 [Syncephalis fuscata]|nr:hypothetical protein BDF19DRAFT_446325 [Syncephalis fuscata]
MASARFQQFMERHRARIVPATTSRTDRGQNEQQQQPQPPLSATQSRRASTATVEGEQRKCWICFGEEEQADMDISNTATTQSRNDTSRDRWVKACSCSLVSHESCLLRWITENQKDIPFKKVHCPQCKAVYQLVESRSFLLEIMSRCDTVIRSTIPFICGIGLGCCLLVTCTTFGAYAVLTLCGTEYGERLLGGPNPWGWRVWIGLPMIPIGLILSRTNYLDAVLPVIPLSIINGPNFRVFDVIIMAYNGLYRLAFGSMERRWDLQLSPQYETRITDAADDEDNPLNTPSQDGTTNNTQHQQQQADPRQPEQVNDDFMEDLVFIDVMHDVMRTVIGALLFPAIASFCGSMLGRVGYVRSMVRDPFNRSILGGCLFVVVKDMIHLLYKRQRLNQRRSRRIRDISEMMEQTAVKL